MITKYEKLGSHTAQLVFESTAEEFSEAIKKAYLQNKGKILVPGFRKGKAPRSLIENLYGKNVFYEDAMDLLFPDAYRAALKEHGIKAVDRPELKNVDQMEEGKPLIFTCTVTTEPDVELGEYSGLAVKKAIEAVKDEDIDARIETERNKVARSVEVTGRALEDGDFAVLDYAGSVDGVPFEGGTAEDADLEIGSGHFIPGFEEQMIGMNIGDEKDLHVTFPEKYHAKDLAGKEAVFHVKLKGINKQELPALDDDFASEVSEFDTLAEFRESIRKELQENIDRRIERDLQERLLNALVQNTKVDIPEAMIRSKVDELMEESDYNYRSTYGVSLEQFLKYSGITKEKYAEHLHANAKERVMQELLLGAVAAKEGLEPTEADIDEELTPIAANMKEDLAKLKASLSEEALENVKASLRRRAAMKWLEEHAVITEVPQEELYEEEISLAQDEPQADNE